MADFVQTGAWGGILLVAGFAAVVVWKLMTGSISLDCLLYGDARPRGGRKPATFFSPGRAQMLVLTLFSAGYYLLQVIQHPTKFPELPNSLLWALGGSHAIYLGGKAQSLYLGRMRDLVALLNTFLDRR